MTGVQTCALPISESRVIGTFNATGPNYEMSMAAMLHGIRACTTAGATLRWLPSDFLSAQRVQPWSDMPVWVPGTGESAGFARVSNARAIAQGLRFRRFVETVADTLSWFAEQPPERQASLRAGLPAAREQALLRDWAATS